jgi:hypothetical protein
LDTGLSYKTIPTINGETSNASDKLNIIFNGSAMDSLISNNNLGCRLSGPGDLSIFKFWRSFK